MKRYNKVIPTIQVILEDLKEILLIPGLSLLNALQNFLAAFGGDNLIEEYTHELPWLVCGGTQSVIISFKSFF